MNKPTRIAEAVLVLLYALVALGTAQGATDEQKCLRGRVSAKARYERCVGAWLAKGYGTGIFDEEKLSGCRVVYAAVWPRLQRLTDSATCGDRPRFVDNGDGTISDNLSGLVWEKKGDNGDLSHDKDIKWCWSTGSPYKGNGDVFTVFVNGLNRGSFAQANDWRLPTFAELQTILLPERYPCATVPCAYEEFDTCPPGCDATRLDCSCTHSDDPDSDLYISGTTGMDDPDGEGAEWGVDFRDGYARGTLKENYWYARAVRGGL